MEKMKVLVMVLSAVIGIILYRDHNPFNNKVKDLDLLQEKSPETNTDESVLTKIKNGLHSIKVSKLDSSIVEQQLDQFTKWEEGAEMTQMNQIPVEKLPHFLDHLLEVYQDSGLTEEDRKKWDGILFAKDWTSRFVEWKFNVDTVAESGVQGARYGIIAFAKSPDGKFVDCMLAIYKLDFKLAPKMYLKDNSILWGLYTWSTVEKISIDRSIHRGEITRFQNFFRHKALMEFKSTGIMDRISYTEEKRLL
uniref:Uncharacterized protein LOC111121978 isoform X1 n=1 Tax=Crassostrea virginica TaxID=6565 RepID=A0A8B8CTK7_CRAVI|nr:uncharacterized protein LOC111121978 isoform X1 [Crassostrea virginica]